jgi:DNA ligase-1
MFWGWLNGCFYFIIRQYKSAPIRKVFPALRNYKFDSRCDQSAAIHKRPSMQFSFSLSGDHKVGIRAGLALVGLVSIVMHGAVITDACAQQTKPSPAPVMLANSYQRGVELSDYWVSEKYDGVRGYWDGKKLLTRGGEVIGVPAWFV